MGRNGRQGKKGEWKEKKERRSKWRNDVDQAATIGIDMGFAIGDKKKHLADSNIDPLTKGVFSHPSSI